MKTNLLYLLFSFFALTSYAQSYSIGGSITEADTREPLPLVKVMLLNEDSVNVSTTQTDTKGVFLFKVKDKGQYILVAQFMGFDTLTRNIEINDKQRDIKLSKLNMKPSTKQLDEVEVNALSRMMTMKKDTLMFNSASFACHLTLR